MIIELNEDYRIAVHEWNWTLQERKISKKSQEERWESLGYYPNAHLLHKAFPGIIAGKLDSYQEVVDVLQRVAESAEENFRAAIKECVAANAVLKAQMKDLQKTVA